MATALSRSLSCRATASSDAGGLGLRFLAQRLGPFPLRDPPLAVRDLFLLLGDLRLFLGPRPLLAGDDRLLFGALALFLGEQPLPLGLRLLGLGALFLGDRFLEVRVGLDLQRHRVETEDQRHDRGRSEDDRQPARPPELANPLPLLLRDFEVALALALFEEEHRALERRIVALRPGHARLRFVAPVQGELELGIAHAVPACPSWC